MEKKHFEMKNGFDVSPPGPGFYVSFQEIGKELHDQYADSTNEMWIVETLVDVKGNGDTDEDRHFLFKYPVFGIGDAISLAVKIAVNPLRDDDEDEVESWEEILAIREAQEDEIRIFDAIVNADEAKLPITVENAIRLAKEANSGPEVE